MPAVVNLIRGFEARLLTQQCLEQLRATANVASDLWLAPTERVRDEVSAAIAPAHIVTFPELARSLAEPVPSARILPESHQRLLLDELLQGLRKSVKLYREMIGRPGFGDAVFSLISELQGLGITPALFETALHVLSERDTLRRKDSELALIYARYVLLLGENQLFDRAALYSRAIGNLAKQLPPRFAQLRTVFVDGFSDFTPPQYALLQGLAKHAETICITLPGDSPHDPARTDLFLVTEQTATQLRNRLRAVEQPFAVQTIDQPAGLSHLRQQLIRQDGKPSISAIGLNMIEAPGLVGEVRLIARAVKERLLDGTRPDSILVSARRLTEYSDLIRSTFGEYGIPIDLDGTDPLAGHPAVATLLTAANVADVDFPFDDTTFLLRSTWLAPSWPEFVADPDIAIDSELLLRLIGEPRGKVHYLSAIRKRAERVDDGLENEEAGGAARRQVHELAKRCEPFLIRFFAAWDRAPTQAAFLAHAEWLNKLADDLGISDQAPELEHLWHELDRWAEREQQLHRKPPVHDRAEFLQLTASLAAATGLPRAEAGPDRVRVVPAELAVGLTYDHLYLLGLGERGFPSAPSVDPLYDEGERQALHGTDAGLGLVAEHLPAEMLLFFRLVTGATQSVTLAFAAVDAKGQELLPGSFLREVRGLFTADAIPLVRKEMSVEGLDHERPLSLAEYRIRYAVAGGDGSPLGPDLTRHLAAARSIVERRNRGNEFGPFDGLLSDPAARAEVARRLGPGHAFSATALEQYVDCPFKFFVNQVLKLAPLDAPAEQVEAHRRGAVYHRALARVHRKGADKTTVSDHLSKALAAAIAEEAAQSSSPVLKKLWELECKRLQRSSRKYASHWDGFCDPWLESGKIPQPRFQEESFRLSLEGIELHGMIDRIDVVELADGSIGFWVIDYKTGRKGNYTATAVQNLLRLQLGIYALAAEQKLGGRPLGLTYWLLAEGVKTALPAGKPINWLSDPAGWREYRARLIQWLSEVTKRARTGAFPLAPRSDTSCKHCPSAQACRIAGGHGDDRTWTLMPGGEL